MTGEVTTADGFSDVVLRARRERDLSVSDLARMCDLPPCAIVDVEAGEPPTAEVRASIGVALRIPLAPSTTVVPPRPINDRHALKLHLVRRLNHDRGRLELHPDATAWWLARDAEPETSAPLATTCADPPPSGPRSPIRRWGLPLMGLCSVICSFPLVATCAWWLPLLTALVPPAAMLTTFAVQDRFARAAAAFETARVEADRAAAADRSRAEVRQRSERTAKVLVGRGFLIDRRGVETVDVSGEPGVPRAEIRTEEIYGIRVEEVGPRHVTVHLRTVHGALEMPWLPRTGALLDALRAVASQRDMPWTPSFDVPDA